MLERLVEVLDGRVAHLERVPRGRELARDGLDEEARLRALDGVRGQQARGGEEVGDELDEDKRLGELDGLGRGIVGRSLGAAVGNRGDLHTCENAQVGLRG